MRSTTSGQWVSTITALNITNAMNGRVKVRTMAWRALGRSIRRSNQAGIPRRSMGGATSEISVCWTMWTLNRYRSDRSWIGQDDATRITAAPDENQVIWRRLAGACPSETDWGPSRASAQRYDPSRATATAMASGWRAD